MHVLVLSCEPDSHASGHVLPLGPGQTGGHADPDSLASLLDQLGCRVSELSLVSDDWPDPLPVPDILIVDAGDDMGAARRAIEAVSNDETLGDVPILLAVSVPRLSSLDFALGFDDFVLRPFVPAEVHARLRHIDHRTSAFGSAEKIKLGDLSIDLSGREVHVGPRSVALTPQEFELLRFLAENLGRALEREELLRKVWGYSVNAATRTVDIHIRRLRAKLGPPWDSKIETVRHVGYKLRK